MNSERHDRYIRDKGPVENGTARRRTGTEGQRRHVRRSSPEAFPYEAVRHARQAQAGSAFDDDEDYGNYVDEDYEEPLKERGKRHSRGKKKKKRRILKALLVILLFFVGFFAVKNILQGNNWTVAVFGVDARDGNLEEGTRSDVIMIVNVNKRSGEVKLVSVFRDTYLKIDDEGNYNKINAAYERGGHEQAIEALEENLDIKIDDYITFSWAAVAKGINALGGIDLEISDAEFSYINAFITETVNSTGIGSTQLKSAGMNHLDGVQAVAYGRLRLMDTDFNRTARQRKVIGLAVDKAKAADFDTLKNTALAVLPEVSTSVGIDDLLPLLRDIDKYTIGDSTGFPFSRQTMDIGRLDCVVATTLSSNVTTLHQILYGEEDYSPSETVESISRHIGEVTGLTAAGENAPEAGTGGGISHREETPETAAPTEAVPPETEGFETETGESETAESETGESESSEAESSESETSESENESESETSKEENGIEEGQDSTFGEAEESDVPTEAPSESETRPAETVSPILPESPEEPPQGGTGVVVPGGPGSITPEPGAETAGPGAING